VQFIGTRSDSRLLFHRTSHYLVINGQSSANAHYYYTSKTAFWAGWFPIECAGPTFAVKMLAIWLDEAEFWKWLKKKLK